MVCFFEKLVVYYYFHCNNSNFLAELKYQHKQARNNDSSSGSDGEHEGENDFQKLLSSFNKSKKQEEIESSSESEEEEEEVEEVEEVEENDSDQESQVSEDDVLKSDDDASAIASDEEVVMNDDSDVEASENDSDVEDDQEDDAKSDLEVDEEVEENSDEEVKDEDNDNSDVEETEDEDDEENLDKDKTVNVDFLDDSLENDLMAQESETDEEEFDSDIENEEASVSKKQQQHSNPYSNHISFDLSTKLFDAISSVPPKTETTRLQWPILNHLLVEIPKTSSEPANKKKHTLLGEEETYASEGVEPTICKSQNFTKELSIRQQIVQNIAEANQENLKETKDGSDSAVLTPLQNEMTSIISNYQDFYYPHRTFQNGEEIRLSYAMHALDHILKTRTKVLHHNAKLSKLKANKKNVSIPDSFRDQGFVRPRVLIVLPFRDSAFRVINMIIDLLNPNERASTMNYKRFVDEFSGQSIHFPKKNPKPEDYEQTFSGNTEDTFRIGLSVNKKAVKLYAPFYSSDILIASPLGLRLIIGAPGEKDREYDFLASVELLILDQMELFVAQNWDHLVYMFDHLHLQPQSRQNTDFSRVRSWCLNGWSKFYRQTLLFSSHDLPEFRSLFNNRCRNYRGKVRTANPILLGSIRHVLLPLPQIFHRIEVKSIETSFDTRFQYFINTILPQFKSATMAHCMIYVPSYFDYIRIRNYLKKEELNFTQICEYTKDNKISRARTLFYHGGAHFMLYSERAHFFRRTRVKGIRHIIMYQPPVWSHFYPEMINLMHETNQNPRDVIVRNSMTVTVLYTKYDLLQMSAIVGSENVAKMIQTKKQTHMFKNED